MPGALSGLTVLDFGQYIAGPLTAMLLADQGADVIRVDPPGGPRLSSPANQVWNRGKRHVVLDLHNSADRALAQNLVARSDVVVENFRPGVMERLELGHEAMIKANPGLVYCSIPGFAHDDARAKLQAWEGLVQAAAAIPARPGIPAMSAVPVASVFGAMYASVSISMALRARARDGLGQWVEIPLLDAALGAHGFRVQRVHRASTGLESDAPLPGVHGWMGAHECADGRYVFFHPGNKNAAAFVESVGGSGWAQLPNGADLMRALFRTRTASQWEDLGVAFKTEVAAFRTSAEWLQETHALESGIVVKTQDPIYGPMLQPGVQVRLDRTPGSVGTPPAAARSGLDILAAMTERPPAAKPHRLRGASVQPALACLDGVRVLEMSFLLAGPSCGRTMVEFGADVVKLENPHAAPVPDAWSDSYHAFHLDANRGKRSITVDLKTEAGLDVFWRLAERADVIIQNYRPGVMDALGVGYEAVRKHNPRIVYASINAYGVKGPWSDLPGHEHLAQTVSGMAERFGGGGPPKLQTVRAPTDHGTGLMAAYAIGLALLERESSGQGQHVHAALAATATLLQAPFMYDMHGRVWDEMRGQETLGSGPLQRLYKCRDMWLYLGCTEADLDCLATALDLDLPVIGDGLEVAIEERLITRDAAAWAPQLVAAGIGAHRLNTLTELLDDDELRVRGLVVTREHVDVGVIDQLGPIPRLSRTPVRMGSPSTPLGTEGLEILRSSGLGQEISRLVDDRVVVLR